MTWRSRELSEAEANRLLAPTKERASRFVRTLPVLAYVARVSKPVYWHPKNPIRPLLAQAGADGSYALEVHRMTIESLEGPRKEVRRWPLRRSCASRPRAASTPAGRSPRLRLERRLGRFARRRRKPLPSWALLIIESVA